MNPLGFHFYKTWTYLCVVSGHANIDCLSLMGIEIVKVQRTELLNDDCIRPR